MFGMFNNRKKSDLEKQIELDGVDHAIRRLTEVILQKISSKAIAYQFVLEELEGASMGNSLSKDFVKKSGISVSEYKGAMNNSMIEVDGPEGPQQFLRNIGVQLSESLRVQVNLGILQGVMEHFSFGSYKPEKISINGELKLQGANVTIVAIVSNNEVIYINNESDYLYRKDKHGHEKLDGSVVNINFIEQSTNAVIEVFVAFSEPESYMIFTLKQGMMEQLNYVTQEIYNYFIKKFPSLLSTTGSYSTKYIYAFIVYRVNHRFFMVNNSQTEGYIIDKKEFLSGNADKLKSIFWKF